jgi:competence protein ComEC
VCGLGKKRLINFFRIILYTYILMGLLFQHTMDSKLFIFISACVTSLYWTSLPSLTVTLCLLFIAVISFFFQKIRLLAFLFIGLSWMASVGHWQYSLQLPFPQIKQAVWVEGHVKSLNHETIHPRFNLSIDKLESQSFLVERLIRLSWSDALWPIKQGQRVRLLVKLKPPHGLANEAGFNYQQWLFSENITATGYVKNASLNQIIEDSPSFRQSALDHLLQLKLHNERWIAALTLGYRGLLQDDDWTLVQSTGIAHLIAISGLHLALIATLSYFLLAWLIGFFTSRFYQLHCLNMHKLAIVGTLFTTFAYSALAGFGLPTLRAWISLMLLTSLFLNNINASLSRTVLLCMTSFILLFPLSLFGLSFWLSFSAVLIIIFVFWRWPNKQRGFSLLASFTVMVRIQLALSVLMLPIIAWQFAYISWLSPLINLVAVPFVTLVLVPLCLLAILFLGVSPTLAQVVYEWIDQLLNLALSFLQHSLTLSWGVSPLPTIPLVVWGLFLVAIVCLMLPNIGQAKPYVVIFFLPLLSFGFESQNTDWQIDVLDVGQGTAVLISKQGRAIMYDVGPAYPSGFNMADSVIVPLLKARNIKQLDYLIISHWDNDHSGSLKPLQKQISITQMLTTDDLCQIGHKVFWQGLTLNILWPDDPQHYNDNNGSCVIQVTDGFHSALLPGDIDASVELTLLKRWGDMLKSDILLAAHHGSNTSSSAAFIQGVSPKYVVFTLGFLNRWQFPRKEVLARFSASLATLYTSANAGQVSFNIPFKSDKPIEVETFRQDIYPYWYANFP